MASDGPTPFPVPVPWPYRPPAIETPPRPVPAGPLISWLKNTSSTPSEPRLSPAATMRDDILSALTPPLYCASILQRATSPQVVAFESWTMSASICLNCFTLAESRKPNLWTCLCVFTFSSSALAFLIEMNFSFKSMFAIWSLSLQRFHYYFYLSIVS